MNERGAKGAERAKRKGAIEDGEDRVRVVDDLELEMISRTEMERRGEERRTRARLCRGASIGVKREKRKRGQRREEDA